MRLISVCIFIFCTIQNGFCDDIIVEVQQGSLKGAAATTVVLGKPYVSFKGIPYAKPPVGNLRFKAPQEPEKWDGVRDATAHGNVCPQFNPISGEYTHGSEDCMFLNVYCPSTTASTLRPVIAFIHGGAYKFGSGNDDLYGPDFFIDQDVCVVTFNYRLDLLGFLSLGTEDVPGNAALKDQVAALKWIQNNIAKFGGDPNKVTLLGDTAGGHSVSLHLLSPMSKGLFEKAIAISGAGACDFGLSSQPERRAEVLGTLLGWNKTVDLLSFLQEVDYDKFFTITPTVLASEETTNVLFKMEYFTPVIEKDFGNNFLTEDPNKLLKAGKVNKDVDAIFGHNNQESLLLIDLYNASYIPIYKRYPELFVPSIMLIKNTPESILAVSDKVKQYYFGDKDISIDNIDLFVNYASSASINYHAKNFAQKWSKVAQKTYFFVISYYSSLNVYGQQGAKYGIKQSSHFDFVFYGFNPVSLNRSISKDSAEYNMILNLTTSLANFAKTSNPSVGDNVWGLYDASSSSYMDFGNDGLTVKSGPDNEGFNFWKDLYKFAKTEF